MRQAIRQAAAEEMAATACEPRGPERIQHVADRVLGRLELTSEYLGFAMVVAANAYWGESLRAVPFHRRLLLLPRCLTCGAASGRGDADRPGRSEGIESIRRRARAMGYRIIEADGTPVVLEALAQNDVAAIVGVACLDSLEAVFRKVWHLGIPAVAVPLLNGNCRNTTVDLGWVGEYVDGHDPSGEPPSTGYLPALQAATAIFSPPRLDELLRDREPAPQCGALGEVARIGRDWLASGGKRLRPFIMLAAATPPGPEGQSPTPSEEMVRVALAIEAFHKASLAHDDIEDDDDERYGQPTLHRRYGQAAAINVGDYLQGLGYRLIASVAGGVGTETAAAVVAMMSRAHQHLAQGQGAELAWRREGRLAPAVRDVLRMYALKTAPAFAAALGSGVRLSGAGGADDRRLEAFSRYVGVGYQVLNDLDDWAADVRHTRPTYLTALAAEIAGPDKRDALVEAIRHCRHSAGTTEALGRRFDALGVFDQAEQFVARLRQRAKRLAEQFEGRTLRELCTFLVDFILT